MKKKKLRVDRLLIVIGIALFSIATLVFAVFGIISVFNTPKPLPLENEPQNDEFKQDNANIMIAEPVQIEQTPEYEYEYAGNFKLTSYCSCPKCCGEWSGGPTASGVMPTANHTVAADLRVFPFGTVLVIRGKEYVVEDTGSAIEDKKIDIFVNNHEDCYGADGNGYADVYIKKEVK